MDRLDYYGCLGVTRDASQEDIKRAFRRMVRRSHPDLNPDDPEAAKRLRNVISAYHILGEPDSRARYDCVDTLFGPRRVSLDEVADKKSAFWEELLYRQNSHAGATYQRATSARRPFVLGLMLIWLAAILLFLTIRSEWFTRNPFGYSPRFRMHTEGLGSDEASPYSIPDPRNDWAIEYWSNECSLNPNSQTAKRELGRRYASFSICAFQRGNHELARVWAQTAVSLSPQLPEAKQALRDLQMKSDSSGGRTKPVSVSNPDII